MPIYEFKCKSCGHRFIQLVLSKDLEIKCPKCGSKDVKKLFSSFASSSKSAGGCLPTG